MKHQFVVGHGGGEGGSDALAFAMTLADALEPDGGAAIAVVVAYPSPAVGRFPADHGAALRDEACRRVEALRAAAPDRPGLTFLARAGTSPAHALHAHADEVRADAIVVGRPPGGALARVATGSVTDQALHGAPVPVAVAPRDHRSRCAPLRALAVGFDDSPEGAHALAAAAAIAGRTRTALRVVRVLEWAPTWFDALIGRSYPFDDHLAETRRTVERACAPLVDLDVTIDVVADDPVRALAAEPGVDLVVVGSRGFGPLRRVLLGSTGARLAHHDDVPLLVLPRSAGG